MAEIAGRGQREKAVAFMVLGWGACLVGFGWHVHQLSGFNIIDGDWWGALIKYFRHYGVFHPDVGRAFKQAGIIWGLAAFLVMILANWRWSMRRTDYGAGQWARPRDIPKMGLDAENGIVLGRKGKKLLVFDKYYAAIVWAPPGAFKTQGVVIPSILSLGAGSSAVINDPSEELYNLTAGHRGEYGPVVRISWSSPDTARWNPISTEELPNDIADLQTEIDGIWHMLIPKGGDAQFDDVGRSLGVAVTFFNILQARERGEDARFGEIVHWLTEGAAQDCYLDDDDPTGAFLTWVAATAEGNGWPRMIASSVRLVANSGYRERSGYINTMLRGLKPWENAHVAAATAQSDFHVRDLRGKNGKPLTVYVCIPEKDVETFGSISGILLNQVMRHLLSQTPEDAKRGKEVSFIIDEVGGLPSIPKVILDGPARGRKLRTRYLFVWQDPAQARRTYSQDGLDMIKTTGQYQVVFHQRNERNQQEISRLIGDRTRERKALARNVFAKGKRQDRTFEGVPLIAPADIGALKEGECFILAPHYGNRPLHAQAAAAFKIGRFKRAMKKKPPAPGRGGRI